MCFSPQADLVGGIVIGAIGMDAVGHCRRPREVALASLPLLLAAHQFVETFVWWGLQGRVAPAVGRGAMWAYLAFAFGVLPVLVPAAVMAIEPSRRRRWLMAPFLVLGAGVAVVLIVAMVRGPVSATLAPYRVNYDLSVPEGLVVVDAYVLATCGSLLASSYRHVRLFGTVNLAAAVVIAWLATSGFASLWCFWAAVFAGAIALHLRFAHAHRDATPAPHPT
jgi:hypothetical protein